MIHAARRTPKRIGSVTQPWARSPSMSEKSFVDIAPEQEQSEDPADRPGFRGGDARDERPAGDLEQAAARDRDREVGREPVALGPAERRKRVDERRESADAIDEERGVERERARRSARQTRL